MKIYVITDIHGSFDALDKFLSAVSSELLLKKARLIILGDIYNHGPRNPIPVGYAPMQVAAALNAYRDCVVAVRGNCDSEIDQTISEFTISCGYKIKQKERTFVFTHGHIVNADHPATGLSAGDVVMYGHFHRSGYKEVDGVKYICVGSLGMAPAGEPPVYAVIEDDRVKIVKLDGGETVLDIDLTKAPTELTKPQVPPVPHMETPVAKEAPKSDKKPAPEKRQEEAKKPEPAKKPAPEKRSEPEKRPEPDKKPPLDLRPAPELRPDPEKRPEPDKKTEPEKKSKKELKEEKKAAKRAEKEAAREKKEAEKKAKKEGKKGKDKKPEAPKPKKEEKSDKPKEDAPKRDKLKAGKSDKHEEPKRDNKKHEEVKRDNKKHEAREEEKPKKDKPKKDKKK